MSKSQLNILLAILGLCLITQANASLINIIDDHTSAYAQVTFDPGAVADPGTTLETFSGPIFPSALFFGYNLDGARSAIIPIDADNFDIASFSAVNYASISGGYYRFLVSLGAVSGSMYGATGSASAETDLKLRFQVAEGDSSIDLFAAYEGNAPVSLSLFDETDGVSIASLAPSSWGYESAEGLTLHDSHVYTLTGSLYAFTPLSGDPSSNFGFRFADKLAISDVPEPGSLSLLLLGLIGMGYSIRQRS